MKAKIYMVTMTSYTTSDNNLYNNTWTYDNEEEARQQYTSLRDEQSKECRWGANYDNDDHTDDCEYTMSEREDGCTYEASSEAYEGYRVQVKMECREIDITTTDAEEDLPDDCKPEEPVKMGVLQVFFNDREQYERAKTIYDSEGESQFWAGDWNDEFRMIEFAEAGELDTLEKALTEDLEHFNLTGYHFEGKVTWA